ncbi:MAG: tRNA1(Val) (adenine(37)-N6)-methyltransferase [Ruminococcus sp.]|nr:tRNA1(Val) (adenine(37)-N6)-methyltransferase [Candidatus Copronaster equi]
MENFRKEYLGSGISVFISDEHGFGTDAVLLADFASPKRKEKACDFGTGCGIIPLLWCRNNCAASIRAVEIQAKGYEQAVKSVKESQMEDKVSVYNCDLKEINKYFDSSTFDVVTMNPPYKAENSGIESLSEADLIARHEVKCNLDDICKSASYLLKFGGRLCLCNRPERLSDTIFAMKQAGIEPKRLRFVVKTPDKRPWLFMIEGKKGSKPFLNVDPLLIMYGSDGNLSDEVINIYGEYKENCK